MISANVVIKVQFYDLDPMGVVWHGNYARFLEQARSALFEKLSFGYREMSESGFAWPIVDMRIKYVRPIDFSRTITVTATLVEYENRLKVNYIITDADGGAILTRAHTIQVTVDRASNELCFETPAALVEKVRRWL
ncbi:acyl-CoA thioesterase [Candidatus Binatus sp.]|jgi:acyl-CoA thioester hydrolase|uniref:acyl-CoA thioesterase n=1 Tax=Candidatus Binatus sp. TaxID=2811406 RepID=UPI002FDAD43F